MAGVCGRDETDDMTMLFSSVKLRDRQAADRLYAACVRAAREPALYCDYGVPDTLQGRFEMLALHLFPLLHRLMHEPGDNPKLARLVSESFVADMDATFREMGVGDITVPRRMNTLYRSFAGRISAYAAALGEGEDALVDAIARNVFPDAPQNGRARLLARRLQSVAVALSCADLDQLQRGDAPFAALSASQQEEPKP